MADSTVTRRSTAGVIFAQLREEIMSLDLLPGTKLSEAEVAEKFGVSRQPVREALNLLSSEELVAIQPQKATRVRLFSSRRIRAARFARRALEIEVGKLACESWSEVYRPGFIRCLEAQERAVAANDMQGFRQLDEEFHALLAETANATFMIEQIMEHKAHVDRICMLSLKETHEMEVLVSDHRAIFECLSQRDAAGLEAAMRAHLARIEKTIEAVRVTNEGYFSD